MSDADATAAQACALPGCGFVSAQAIFDPATALWFCSEPCRDAFWEERVHRGGG